MVGVEVFGAAEWEEDVGKNVCCDGVGTGRGQWEEHSVLVDFEADVLDGGRDAGAAELGGMLGERG